MIHDILPAPLRSLVDLFDGRLAEVHFPGVDRSALGAAVEGVAHRAQDVLEARRLLDDAQRNLDDELDGFRQLAQRALAYAEIYADGDPELTAVVGEIRLDIEPKKAAKPSPTRRRKKKVQDPELPLAEAVDAAAEPAARPEPSPASEEGTPRLAEGLTEAA